MYLLQKGSLKKHNKVTPSKEACYRVLFFKGFHVKRNTAIALIFVLFVSMFCFFRAQMDPDLWGHLQFGKDIYEQRGIPEVDTYSYSAYGAKSINHEWLAELIFYSLFFNFSSFGLVIFKFSIALALSIILYREMRKNIQSELLFVAVFLLVIKVISYGFAIRTQIFTYLLFAVVLITLKRHEDDSPDNALLFSLPPIFMVWCNLHGGFVAALAIMAACVTVKMATQRMLDKKLFFVTLLSVLATLINPYGIELWRFLIRSMTDTPLIYISEWNRVYVSATFISYYILLAVTLIIVLKQKMKPFEYILIVAGVCYSFSVNRHTVLFSLIFAIFLPQYVAAAFDALYLRIEKRLSNNFFPMSYLLCSLFFLWATFFSMPTSAAKILVPAREYPVDAVEFLKINEIHGNLFPWFDWGEMCIGEMPGKSKVFFDGRFGIVYNDEFIKEYFEVVYTQRDYKTYLSKYPETDIFLLDKSNTLSASLSEDPDYKLIFSSSIASVFLKKNEHNRESLKKFAERRLIYPELKEPFYFERMPR